MSMSKEEYSIASALPAINRASLDLPRSQALNLASTDPHHGTNTTERSRLHHRLHANSLRAKGLHRSGTHHHHHQQHAKDAIQSALHHTTPLSLDHLLRPEKENSRESSRRGSEDARGSATRQAQQQQQAEAERQARRKVKPGDVFKAKVLNEKREEELRESLKSVEQVGMDSTRKLDDTYYSILEKVAVLRSTIGSLQQLSNQSRMLHTTFQAESGMLEQETKGSLAAFNGFESQEKTIDDLVKKLKDGKAKTDQLGKRLEAAKQRVQAYEQRESEVQAKRRKRWNITWMMLSSVVALVVAAIFVRHHALVKYALGSIGNDLGHLGGKIENVSYTLRPNVGDKARLQRADEDPLLHPLFDDL